MTQIPHRWEWRAFGSRLEPAESVLSALEPVGDIVETEETYLLASHGVNVKIRFDLLDIKELKEVDENGLELWAPISKMEFPMSAAEALSVFDAWGMAQPESGRSDYDLSQFLEELISPHPNVEAVLVRKRRVRYSIEGCMAELTSLTANGIAAKTVAAETHDPNAVVNAVETLGMFGYRNTNYNRGLRCMLGDLPARYAVVDIGTNSVKFHIGEQSPDGTWARVVDRAEVTRLGEGLDETGEIGVEPLERTVRAVDAMVVEAAGEDALATASVGTAALRLATNSSDVIAAIREKAGINVEVVSGEEESRLAFLAVAAGVGLADGAVVVFDTGGGSTQFTFGRGGEVEERYSLNVGAVSYTERFGLDGVVDDRTIEKARTALSQEFASLDGRDSPDALVGMGGAVTNLTAVSLGLDEYDPDRVQGAIITAAEIRRQIELYRSMGHEERHGIVGLQPNRAPVILAGALIVSTVIDALGRDSIVVSDRGLRHGLIRERFGLF